MSGPLTAGERYEFDLRGYVVRHGALVPNEVRLLRLAVVELGHARAGDSIQSQRFTGHLSRHEVFRDLIDHPAVLEPILEMCGPKARLDHTYGITMRPNTAGLGLHGGGTPHDPAQYYRVENGRMYNGLVAVQWALVDHRPGDGGFGCIPGSHRASFALPADPEDHAALTVEVPMAAGDVVFFTEALTHCTIPWRGAGDRLTLLYKYAPGHLAWGIDYQQHTDLAPLMTDRQNRLLQAPAVHPHQAVER
ncbi:MAG: protein involved in biosynthesis of mitomycin antibiotics/polyketide fumonisin [Ilumatobacteraceae bacterium]|nr:protein involved in biosynthesis of mitomycin antibiotics/polyketide fumonisin [Ilumatobacteraceae bacterium]